MSRLRQPLLAAAAVLLIAPAAASASIQDGTYVDDTEDAPAGQDIAEVAVKHDTATGTTAAIRIFAVPASVPATARVLAAVGSIDDDGRCTGRVILEGALKPGAPFAQAKTVDDAGTEAVVVAGKTGSGTTITLTSAAVRPGGGQVDCAYALTYDPADPDPDAEPFDATGGFSLDTDTPIVPPPPPPRPAPTPPPPPPAPKPEPAPDLPGPPAAPEKARPYSLSKKVPSLKKKRRSYIYGICRYSICRVDPVTRKLSRVKRSTRKSSAYSQVSTSRNGSTMAYVQEGDVYRAGRDGRGAQKYGDGFGPTVRADGRVVAWFQTRTVSNGPSCTVDFFNGGLNCNYITGSRQVTSVIYRNLGTDENEGHTSGYGAATWSKDVVFRTEDPDVGEATYVCATDAEGDCATTVAQDASQALTDPASSPDGRFLAVVSEPAPKSEDADRQLKGSIVLYDPKTGRKVRQLTSSRRDEHPIFSPDGRQVAFNRGKDLLVVSVRGGRPKLVKRDVELSAPSWSLAR